MKSRVNSVNSRTGIAYMLKSDLSRKISHDHTRADERYTSTESEQQGHKRKRFTVNQQRGAKRARRIVAQSTHLSAAALQSIQDEQKKSDGSNGFEAS